MNPNKQKKNCIYRALLFAKSAKFVIFFWLHGCIIEHSEMAMNRNKKRDKTLNSLKPETVYTQGKVKMLITSFTLLKVQALGPYLQQLGCLPWAKTHKGTRKSLHMSHGSLVPKGIWNNHICSLNYSLKLENSIFYRKFAMICCFYCILLFTKIRVKINWQWGWWNLIGIDMQIISRLMRLLHTWFA